MVDAEIKRELKKKRYLIVYLFALMIFFTGIFIGWMFSSVVMYRYQESQDILRAKLIGLEMRNDLVEDDLCNYSLDDVFEEKRDLGARIHQLESKRGKDDAEVLLVKEYYQLVELRTFLLASKFEEECESEIDLVLFFYTNEEGLNGDRSEDLGYILTNLYARYLSFEVFVFDEATDNPALNALRKKYGVIEYPSLVINDELFVGFYSSHQLERMLDLEE